MSAGSARVSYTRMLMGGAAAALAVGMALTGCTSGGTGAAAGPTVASLARTMRADFLHAKSLRIAEHLTLHGRQVALDLRMLRSGDFEGTFVVGGSRVRVVRSGASTYAFVSKSFFRYLHVTRGVPAAACSVICGKYVKVPRGAIPDVSLSKLTDEPVAAAVVTWKIRAVGVRLLHDRPLARRGAGRPATPCSPRCDRGAGRQHCPARPLPKPVQPPACRAASLKLPARRLATAGSPV